MKRSRSILWLSALLLLGGCAAQDAGTRTALSAQQVAPARMAGVLAAAGAPVGSFRVGPTVAPRIYAWETLSNRELLVYTRPNTAWLIGVGPCPRLFDTPYLALTTTMNQVDRFSKVLVFRSRVACRVESIRPVEVSRLEVAMTHRPGARVLPRRGDHWAGAAR